MSHAVTSIHPGVELKALLAERGMTQREFGRRMDVSLKHVNEICNGKSLYSADFALRMERVLGLPAGHWLTRLAEYRLARARQRS